jgi:hypothetical protein
MDAPFPFGFPLATGFYLTLYVVTLAVHVVFMSYVLAGSGYIAIEAIARARKGAHTPSPAAAMLRDFMPFAIGVAITAGVAPLLFVQILYQHAFYSANLLLFHRFMAILPALVAGFYLAYLLKTEWLGRRSLAAAAAVAAGAFACFFFTGYSWTENHLLSVSASAWPGFYGSGAIAFTSPEIAPRLATWLLGGIPTMAAILGWQLRGRPEVTEAHARRLSVVALSGVVLAAASGAVQYAVLDPPLRAQFFGPLAAPYLGLAVLGLVAQGASWAVVFRNRHLGARPLAVASAGCVVAILGMAVVREALRLARVDLPRLFAEHEQASAASGLPVFLGFLLVNAILIAWVIRTVRGRQPRAG